MGRGRRDKVYLTLEQREKLEQISRNGYAPAKKILHARILDLCDEGEQAARKWTDPEIAEALNLHRNTVGRMSQRFLPIWRTTCPQSTAPLDPPHSLKSRWSNRGTNYRSLLF